MMKNIRTIGVGRGGWAVALLSVVALSTACTVDENEGEEESTTTSDTNPPPTAGTVATTGETVDPTTSTVTSGGSEDTGPSETGSTTESSDDTSTGGSGACEIMLPPPVACSLAPEGGSRANWLPYDRALGGIEPATDLADPREPAGGGMGGFIMDPDGPMVMECDIFTQDCPAGEKCMPWANDGGGSWNSTRCSPLDPMPDLLDETCVVEGSGVSGIDSCDVGHMCWDVDPMTQQGTCIELCSCSLENPVCNTPNTICSISNGGVLALCLGVCNPLDPSTCEAGQGCYPSGEYFQCAPDASGEGGLVGDPCAFINTCEPGTVCTDASLVPGCAGSSCCSAVCDIGDGAGPCLAGQDCVPWYAPGGAPDECLGEVGVCAAPA